MDQLQRIKNRVDTLEVLLKTILEDNKELSKVLDEKLNDMVMTRVIDIAHEVTDINKGCLFSHRELPIMEIGIALNNPRNQWEIERRIEETWGVDVRVHRTTSLSQISRHIAALFYSKRGYK